MVFLLNDNLRLILPPYTMRRWKREERGKMKNTFVNDSIKVLKVEGMVRRALKSHDLESREVTCGVTWG